MEILESKGRTAPRRASGSAQLEVVRSGIRFHNVAPDRVRIEIEVRNRSATWSQPTPIRLQSAPLGAFVPWQPLATLHAPPIAPGETLALPFEAQCPPTDPAADFAGLVPRALLTAAGAGDGPLVRFDPGLAPLLRAWSRIGPGMLASDLLALHGRGATHWVGNLDVLIGRKRVERHLARGLRIYPGRPNVAMFGLGRSERGYLLRVCGDAADWRLALFDSFEGRAVAPLDDDTFELLRRPFPARLLFFALQPPADAQRGSLELHFQRRPQGDSAVVEFDLDARAAGPGCYAV